MKKILFPLLSIACLTLTSDLAFAALSVTLTPSNHNGYAVSCFGGRDGAINITVSGGTSPYTYLWSTGETTQNVSALPSGFYQVTVTDAVSATCSGNVNLREPTALTLSLTPSLYSPQNTNISCYNCCNGNISISAGGGVTAYSYLWTSGQTTANISSLCKNTYKLTLTDANGCTVVSTQVMTEPDKDAWAQSGNSGSNPSTQFIGTTDNVDLSFRTNNSERLRIKANGDLKINSLSGSNAGMLFADVDGYIWSASSTSQACQGLTDANWHSAATSTYGIIYSCPAAQVGIGISTPTNRLDVNGAMAVGAYAGSVNAAPSNSLIVSGNVGIGMDNPTYKLQVNGTTKTTGLVTTAFNMAPSTNGFVLQSDANGNASWVNANTLNVTGDNMGNNSATVSMDVKLNDNWLNNNGGTNEGIRIDNNGIVGIGIDPTAQTFIGNYKLFVGGKVGIREDLYVRSSGSWPDYVFSNDYKLQTLDEVNNFLKEHSHLPSMPSACDIEDEGQAVGKIQQLQQQKIEELYLYIIKLQNQVNELESKLNK